MAARALHLSRGVEKPSGRVTYIVVLEGLCRFSVQELSTRGTYYTARISSLEMTKIGKFSVAFSFVSNYEGCVFSSRVWVISFNIFLFFFQAFPRSCSVHM